LTTKTRISSSFIKQTFVLFFVMSVLVVMTSAQSTFQKTYGDSSVNDIGCSILQTGDGGFLVAATRYTPGNYIESLFLVRTDDKGDTLWTKLVKEPFVDYSGAQAVQTFDGGFAITGIKGGGNSFVPYLLKIDSVGNIRWNKSYLWFAQEHINSIVQVSDSGFLLGGYLWDGSNQHIYFIRTNVFGDTLWTRSYADTNFNATVYSVRLAKDGGFVACGSIQDKNTQDVNALLFKTDSLGNILWARSYGESDYDYAQQVEVTSDSGFVIAAVTYSFGAGLADFFLIKTDSTGNLLWSKTYGGASDDRSESVRQTTDGGYLFTGESASFTQGILDVYMIRTNAAGDTLWTQTRNGLQNNEGYSLVLTSNGGFAITGNYYSQQGNNDVFLLKAGPNGFTGCGEQKTSAIVTVPATQVINHHLGVFATSPSVIAHMLDTMSGARTETLCATDGMSDAIAGNTFDVYPNPVSDRLNIDVSVFTGRQNSELSIRIINIFGQKVMERKVSVPSLQMPVELDVSPLVRGIYVLEINEAGKKFRMKFVKQ
jgi:hypothetical protein